MLKLHPNSDVGESFGLRRMGADEEVLALVTSANIACGMHAGDPCTISRTVALAESLGVAVGAHPSYPDLEGFGRRNMALTLDQMRDTIVYQVGAVRCGHSLHSEG